MLGLIVVSALVIATKPTKLGLDLKGGIELDLPGHADRRRSTEVNGEDIDRSIEIIRERIDQLGVSEPEVSRARHRPRSRSACPDVTNAQRAIDQVGTTAQLYFYDWEPNLIGREKAIGGHPGSEPPTGALNEANEEWKEAGRSRPNATNQQLIFAGAFPSAYDAVKLASEQEPVTDCTTCSTTDRATTSSTKTTARADRRPRDQRRRTSSSAPTGRRTRRTTAIVLTVPPGTVVVSEKPQDAERPGDSRTPNRAGTRSTTSRRSRAPTSPTRSRNFDEFNQPNVTFNFTDKGREAFQDVTRQIAQRGPGAGDRAGQRRSRRKRSPATSRSSSTTKSRPRPIINFAENPDGIDGRTGAQISGGFNSIQEAQDLATFLQIGALPINLKLISQTPGLGDARPQALHEGLKAGDHRPDPGRPLPARSSTASSALIAAIGAGRLRGDLLRPDQADPDHPDAAGDRGPDPDDRGRGRLQHRHLRANKGGGAGGADRCRARSPPATGAGSRRSSTRTSSPC